MGLFFSSVFLAGVLCLWGEGKSVSYFVRDARLRLEEDLWMLLDRVVTVVGDFDGLPHVVSQSRLSCSNKQKQTSEEDICPEIKPKAQKML